jgi:hypothetical protein
MARTLDTQSYYDFADEAYDELKFLVDNNRSGNSLCILANSICERYLKHIIDVFFDAGDENAYVRKQQILKTHSLRGLCTFIKQNGLIASIDSSKVCQADGYHRSARYPGDDSMFVTKEDVESAWEAVMYCKKIIDERIRTLL